MHRLLSFNSCLNLNISIFNYYYFQTENCGWGVEAAEFVSEGDFIIEYVGEGNVLKVLSLQVCLYISDHSKYFTLKTVYNPVYLRLSIGHVLFFP